MDEKIKSNMELVKEVEGYYKEAFCVDGDAHIIIEDYNNFTIKAIIELNDSKVGKFYIAKISRNGG